MRLGRSSPSIIMTELSRWSISLDLVSRNMTRICEKRKKLICDTEGEIVVAYGRLPSPAPQRGTMALLRLYIFVEK